MLSILTRTLIASESRRLQFIGYSHGDTGGLNGTLTINKPAGVLENDMLVAIMGQDGANATWTGDTGWTEKIDQGVQPNLRIATKVAGASEGVSYTFTQSSTRKAAGIILHFRDAAFDQIGTINTGSPLVAGGITPTSSGILIGAYLSNQSGATFTTPSGMAPIASFNTYSASYRIFQQDIATGATTGMRFSTVTGGKSDAGVLFNMIRS